MRDGPILFSAAMVRRIMSDVDPKTQTRRLCVVQPFEDDGLWHAFYPWGEGGHGIYETEAAMRDEFDRVVLRRGRRGAVGDRLWVRETLRLRGPGMRSEAWTYAADGAEVQLPHGDPRVPAMLSWAHHKEGNTCVSIHMPRWASRIDLEIAREERLERLQDITDEDIRAEGVTIELARELAPKAKIETLREAWGAGWDAINGHRATWASNPMVHVVTFKRVRP